MTSRPTREFELIQAAARGDGEAFGQLVHPCRRRLFLCVVQSVRCAAEAEDVVQEGLLRAFAKLPTFQFRSSFYTWLYRITMNELATRRRRKRITTSWTTAQAARGEPIDTGERPDARLAREERAAEVRAALRTLGARRRAILELREVDGMDYRSIAAQLGLTVAAVRIGLHRARARFRKSYTSP